MWEDIIRAAQLWKKCEHIDVFLISVKLIKIIFFIDLNKCELLLNILYYIILSILDSNKEPTKSNSKTKKVRNDESKCL